LDDQQILFSLGDKKYLMIRIWPYLGAGAGGGFFPPGTGGYIGYVAAVDRSDREFSFSADDLKDWSGRILLVFGSDDPATPREKREAMVKLYSQAEVKVFEGGEHGIAITHQQEYFAVIDEFLAQ